MAGSKPASKPRLGDVALDRTRISISADALLKLSPWICTASNDCEAIACVRNQPNAMLKPTTMAPRAKLQRRWCVLKKKKIPVPSASSATTNPPVGPTPVICSKSRPAPPSMGHQLAKAWRAGASQPPMLACTVTANTKPASKARKFPLPDKISKRLAQPRVKIMPAPNNKPPSTAPEMLPAGPM